MFKCEYLFDSKINAILRLKILINSFLKDTYDHEKEERVSLKIQNANLNIKIANLIKAKQFEQESVSFKEL